jgi:hypothetical protein
MAFETCPECGAPIPEGGSCQENFHALLLLEAEVPGAAGSFIHFYTVASYVLQHPDSMNNTAAALAGLHALLADALDGRVTLAQLRRRGRDAAEGSVRVTRRPGDPQPEWRRGGWAKSVADVLAVGPEAYAATVTEWARSVRDALDGKCGQDPHNT